MFDIYTLLAIMLISGSKEYDICLFISLHPHQFEKNCKQMKFLNVEIHSLRGYHTGAVGHHPHL